MEVKIKKAIIDDAALIAPLFDAYRVFYHQPTDVDAAIAFLQERLSNNESVIFIAFIDGKAVGFTQMYPIFSSVSMGRAYMLNDLYVAEEIRKQGIAQALLNKAKAYGQKNSAKWLMLETEADNLTAQALYEKNGWLKQTGFFYQLALTT